MSNFNDYDLKKIESYWRNYHDYKIKLHNRQLEILYPYRETDENIGGSSSGAISDKTGDSAILLASDKIYNNLLNIVTVIGDLYNELESEEKTIVQMKYWNKKDCYEWKHIGEKLDMSVQRVLRKRNNIIDETAFRLGWV